MPVVTVVHDGWVVREGARVVDACSSVTLIESRDAKVLVDTGSRKEQTKISANLRRNGLSSDEVTHVINTHLHMDHCGCNGLFENARFFAHAAEDPPIGTIRLKGEESILPGVRMLPTPGHTRGSMSVFVESDRRYAICGDAIPTKANYDSHLPPAIHIDRELALRSMDAILGWAAIVVPGHDRPFEVLGKR